MAAPWSAMRRSASIPSASAAPVTAPQVPPLYAIPPLSAIAADESAASGNPNASLSTTNAVSAQP